MAQPLNKTVLLSSLLSALGLASANIHAWDSYTEIKNNADISQKVTIKHKGGYIYNATYWNRCFVPESSRMFSTDGGGHTTNDIHGVVMAGDTVCSSSYTLHPMLGATYKYNLRQCGNVDITTKGTTGYPRANISYSNCLEQGPDLVAMYQHCNYKGNERFYPAGGEFDMLDLENLGLSNDSISSIRVPAGYQVRIYKHNNFTGTSKVLKEDVNCLSSVSMNDQISSFKVETIGVGAYQYQDMSGGSAESATFTPGWYTMSDMEGLGIANDTLSALHVPEGYEVEIYDHHNYTGDFRTIQAGFSGTLADLGFNNKTSSIIVRRVD